MFGRRIFRTENSDKPILLQFSDPGTIKVTRFSGATPALDWLGTVIMNLVIEKNSDGLRQKLETKAKEFLNEALKITRIPITID